VLWRGPGDKVRVWTTRLTGKVQLGIWGQGCNGAEKAAGFTITKLVLDRVPAAAVRFVWPGQYSDDETGLIENWNRYYAPALGIYYQPEPLLQHPSSFLHHGESSIALPVYGYARGNPVQYSDPTGLYLKMGECENWDRAVEKARRWAGCSDTVTNKSCACRERLRKCGAGDVCTILQDGALPPVYFKDKIPSIANPKKNASGKTYLNDVDGRVDSVGVLEMWCHQDDKGNALASVLLHEAIHAAGDLSGNYLDHEDTQGGECDAETITRLCFRGY